jgi:hypothetical protein
LIALVSPKIFKVRFTHPMSVLFWLLAIGVGVGLFSSSARGSPFCTAVVAVMLVSGFLALLVLTLEIAPSGVTYRNLWARHEVAYRDLARASIDIERSEHAPAGVAVFRLHTRAGKNIKVPLRMFSDAAAALLFSQLEMHGVRIEVADRWAARRLSQRIRDAQRRLSTNLRTVR